MVPVRDVILPTIKRADASSRARTVDQRHLRHLRGSWLSLYLTTKSQAIEQESRVGKDGVGNLYEVTANGSPVSRYLYSGEVSLSIAPPDG